MDLRALFMGLSFALIWSSAFTSARVIVEAAPPLTALVIRFFLSGGLGIIAAWMFGQSWRLTRGQWVSVLVFGICQNALYLGLNFVAMQTVEASLAAIIASAMPLLVAVANWTIFKDRLAMGGVVGLVLGFAGVAAIMAQRFGGGADGFGIMLCLIGVVALTIATLAMRGATLGVNHENLLMVVGLQMIVGAIALAPIALMFETWTVTWSPAFVGAFAYTTLMPGLLATFIWFRLVARIGATQAAVYHFLNPFFGVAIAVVLLDEALGPLDIFGVTIIAIGIWLVQRGRPLAA